MGGEPIWEGFIMINMNLIRKTVSAAVLCVVLSVSAVGQEFRPHEILRLDFRSYTGVVNSMSSFAAQVAPDAAGAVMFLSAALAMNPAFAAVDLTRPMSILLLTGAGTVKNAGGEYVPDLFLCAAVTLRENATLQKEIPVGGMRFATFSFSDRRAVLYRPNPLYNKMIREKASALFPVRRDLPQLQLQMELNAMTQLPFAQDVIANGVAAAAEQNTEIPPEDLVKELEKTVRQAEKLTLGVNFPNDRTLELQGVLTLKPDSDTAKLFRWKKTSFDFSAVPVFATASQIFLLDLPDDPKFKSSLIRQLGKTTLPSAFAAACITHASGAILAAVDSAERVKAYIALKPGSARLLLQLMKDDKMIQELSPGLWIVDYQEDGVSTYAKVLDNGLYVVSGRISEVVAKRILDDRTPLPKSVALNSDFLAVYRKKDGEETFTRTGSLRYFQNRISGNFLLHPSDFPKFVPETRALPAK